MYDLTITLDPSALIAILDRLPAALDCRRPPMRDAMDKASAGLMKWELGRFVSASGGDGTWADIKPITKYNRMRRQAKAAGGKLGSSSILAAAANATLPVLYDTGTLQAALFDRGANGHFVEFDAEGVREGARGGQHPLAPISVGELAMAHHYGVPSKRIPARPVMGEPDNGTINVVISDLTTGLNEAFASLAGGMGGSGAVAV